MREDQNLKPEPEPRLVARHDCPFQEDGGGGQGKLVLKLNLA